MTASVLCTAAVGLLWARSMTAADQVGWLGTGTADGRHARLDWVLTSGYGCLDVCRTRTVPNTAADAAWVADLDRQAAAPRLQWAQVDEYDATWDDLTAGLRRFDAYAQTSPRGTRLTNHVRGFDVPDWFIMLAAITPAASVTAGWVRRRQRRKPASPVVV